MLVACYVLVHGNDVVIYTYEIQQMHATFYWVSTIIDIKTCGLPNNYMFLYVIGVIT